MWQGVLTPSLAGWRRWARACTSAFWTATGWVAREFDFFVIVAIIAWQFVPLHTLIYQGGRRAIRPSSMTATRWTGPASAGVPLCDAAATEVHDSHSSMLILVGSLTYSTSYIS